MDQPILEIDGQNFHTLEEFFCEFDRVALGNAGWGHNLDAFNDVLRGGFGTPDGGFVLRWKNSSLSRQRLGYDETIRQLKMRLSSCHPSNRQAIATELEMAKRYQGPTTFDWLVEIISIHGDGGEESEDGVVLELR